MHSVAQALIPWALTGIILVSTIGALVMCLLVFRYGFPPAGPPESRPVEDDVLITRAGPALTGACFAIAALLAVVVLSHTTRTGFSGEADTLRQVLAEIDAQLTRVESQLIGAAAEADVERSRVEDLETRIVAAERSLHRVREDTARALVATRELTANIPPRRPAAITSGTLAPPPSRAAASAPQISPSVPVTSQVGPPLPSMSPSTPPVTPRAVAPVQADPARRSTESDRVTRAVAAEPQSIERRSGRDSEPNLGKRIRADWELLKQEGSDAFRRLREALR